MIRHTLRSGMLREQMPAQVKLAGAKSLPVMSTQLSRHRASRLAKAIRRDIRRRDRSDVKIMPAKGPITKVVAQGEIGMMTAIQPWSMPAIRGRKTRFMKDQLGLELELGNCRHMTPATSSTEYSCRVSSKSRAHPAQCVSDNA